MCFFSGIPYSPENIVWDFIIMKYVLPWFPYFPSCPNLKYTMSFVSVFVLLVGWDSTVGIATRYGLDDPVIESWWGQNFLHPFRLVLGLTQPPVWWVPDLFPRVKRPGRSVDHLPLSSTEVKERVELYLYFPSWPSWTVTGWNLPLFLLSCHCCLPIPDHTRWCPQDLLRPLLHT